MDNSFVAYLQLLEILAFFSGYPIIFLLVKYFDQFPGLKSITKILFQSLPFSYGLIGLLFLGFEIRNAYPEFDIAHFQHPYLIFWGILSLLFLVPKLINQSSWSLYHSLVFLLIMIKNVFETYQLDSSHSQIKNYMNIYSISLGFNLAILLLAFLSKILLQRSNPRSDS
ncbi:MAG: hypothetical protein NTZ19_15965 [Bacteroidetes bacterium]|nr:hypothetical protein [Bacteroidota bacterium]